MAEWENFVQTTLTNAVAFGDTTIVFNNAPSPWNNPPNPNGGLAFATIVDDISNPTVFEIISYTLIEGFGPFTMSGITRGLEGTIARNWSGGAYLTQYLTSSQTIDTHELSNTIGEVEINGGTF